MSSNRATAEKSEQTLDDPVSADRLDEYLRFAVAHPHLFATDIGGVRILLERPDIVAVENAVCARLVAEGLDPSGSRVGIIDKDPWFYLIRDAVEFPTGSRRLHARCVNRINNGVAALPVHRGKIVLLRHFRHAARRWMLEIPRGGIEPGQSLEDAVRLELAEEMGARASRIVPLAFVHGLSNLSFNGAHLHFVELEEIGLPQLDEGISAFNPVEIADFESLVRDGSITDSFTLAAFLHSRLRGLL